MPHYMFRFCFKDNAIKALTETPNDRQAAAQQLIEAFGGRMVSYYFALGEYDGYVVTEFPDTVSAAAASLRVAASGSFSKFETHALMTPAEAMRAMQKVKDAGPGSYRPPAG
jgi:uncharacterized protein with GYD domain